jgi:hypothetical protein
MVASNSVNEIPLDSARTSAPQLMVDRISGVLSGESGVPAKSKSGLGTTLFDLGIERSIRSNLPGNTVSVRQRQRSS